MAPEIVGHWQFEFYSVLRVPCIGVPTMRRDVPGLPTGPTFRVGIPKAQQDRREHLDCHPTAWHGLRENP